MSVGASNVHCLYHTVQCVILKPLFALHFDGQEIVLLYVVYTAIVCHHMVGMTLYTAGYDRLIAADLIWWCL